MNNYFSFGADAKIALDFHTNREKNPSNYKNQITNKIEYAKVYERKVFVFVLGLIFVICFL